MRRSLLLLILFWLSASSGVGQLSKTAVFKGELTLQAVVAKAKAGGLEQLPIGERTARIGKMFVGIPYKSFTLEIDNKIEAPSANLWGMDCWTFFEISLGISRMLERPKEKYTSADLLREIEFTRYRGGKCHGNYLDRIHYLAEWYFENDARGVIDDLSGSLGSARLMKGRKCREMTVFWKSYRYLKHNPSLRAPMATHERRISALPVRYIPKASARSVLPKIRNGDVIGIVTNNQGGFCSHVGLAIKGGDGKMRLMHASSDKKKVIIDSPIDQYLWRYAKNAGMLVGRPQPVSKTVKDPAQYKANLQKLIR